MRVISLHPNSLTPKGLYEGTSIDMYVIDPGTPIKFGISSFRTGFRVEFPPGHVLDQFPNPALPAYGYCMFSCPVETPVEEVFVLLCPIAGQVQKSLKGVCVGKLVLRQVLDKPVVIWSGNVSEKP